MRVNQAHVGERRGGRHPDPRPAISRPDVRNQPARSWCPACQDFLALCWHPRAAASASGQVSAPAPPRCRRPPRRRPARASPPRRPIRPWAQVSVPVPVRSSATGPGSSVTDSAPLPASATASGAPSTTELGFRFPLPPQPRARPPLPATARPASASASALRLRFQPRARLDHRLGLRFGLGLRFPGSGLPTRRRRPPGRVRFQAQTRPARRRPPSHGQVSCLGGPSGLSDSDLSADGDFGPGPRRRRPLRPRLRRAVPPVDS